MKCKCGREISNVPEHLKDLASWVCKECSDAPPSNSLVSLSPSGTLEVEFDLDPKKLTTGHAA